MNALAEISWDLDDSATSAEIVAALSPRFATQLGKDTTSSAHYYDDADAHLWRSNFLLCQTGKQSFRLTEAGIPVAEATPRPGAKFWWDFPAGSLQDALRRLITVRALLPVVSLEVSHTELSLCNNDQKTVVKVRLTRSVVGDQCVQYLTLRPLRGYAADFFDALRCVKPFVRSEADVGTHALLARHRVAAFAPRRAVPMPITDTMPTEQAVRAMAHVMLEQAQHHVSGVVSDIDSEFLHAFRVNLRKARSLLSLLKKSLPAVTINKLKPRLSAMAGATNKLRDLDVYLLAQHEYRALLPANFDAGMRELAALIQSQRAQEQTRITAYFSSAAYQSNVDACLAELSLHPSLETPMASKPVLNLVKRQLLKRYAAILAMSKLIHRDSADDDIHALRIEFKKLRYLIEFFLDLLPKKRCAKLLGDLKKIQAVLGDFSDFSVQVDFLGTFLDNQRIDMSKALSGLIAILHVKKMEKRERIFDAMTAYFSENRAIEFELIFEVRKSGDAK